MQDSSVASTVILTPLTIEHLMDLNCSSLIILEGPQNNIDAHVEFSLWRCYTVKEYDELIEVTHSQNTLVLLSCVAVGLPSALAGCFQCY